jgi:hypothetical protein
VTSMQQIQNLQDSATLCMALMRADTEEEVVDILEQAGYWDDSEAWRLFSDDENSFAVIGNQQAEAVAAFVEKIVNSVDARLVDACRRDGCNPESSDAPASMREAVARFYEGKAHPKPSDGRISEWGEKATQEGRLLTVAATGSMPQSGKQPSLTVADAGEGQCPDSFPSTFMSIGRNNKLRIPFVQGKFNMGGTGAFQFSKFQLVVSRRDPDLLGSDGGNRDREWGFTIVRREPPSAGVRNSVYRYLAPVQLDGQEHRGVLSFDAEDWPIFPEADESVRDAYHRRASYGSMVKLYEYQWEGTKSNIVLSGEGLLRRIEVGLPELALPVRVFECRSGYSGHGGSFATNALGLVARLDREGSKNLESGEPIGGVIALESGKQIKLRAYVFKDKDKAKNYRSARNGVVFSVNGQMHASYPIDFFSRERVNLSYLRDSLLVFADCSEIDGQSREDLFMNSRDRLRVNPVSKQLEEQLASFLKNEPTLREIQNRRRQEATQEKLSDDKPLSEVLEKLVKDNPTLNQLLLKGLAISTPFRTTGNGVGQSKEFESERFPTYFRFKNHGDGEELHREAHIHERTRVSFETDAEDSYFVREIDAGAWNIRRRVGDEWVDAVGWLTTGPKNGVAQLWFDSLPEDAAGGTLEYLIEVTDPSRIDAFEMKLILNVSAARERTSTSGTNGSRNANNGKGKRGGSNRALSLPKITPVRRDGWEGHSFTETSALKIVHAGTDDNESAYDFYVNYDNKYLLHSCKQRGANVDVLEKQFVYGLVLVGLALLQEYQANRKVGRPGSENIEGTVLRTTAAIGSILVPMIQALGGLAADA